MANGEAIWMKGVEAIASLSLTPCFSAVFETREELKTVLTVFRAVEGRKK